MIEPKQIACWKTTDGNVFQSQENARQHQEELDLKGALDRLIEEEYFDPEDVLLIKHFFNDNAREIFKTLKKHLAKE